MYAQLGCSSVGISFHVYFLEAHHSIVRKRINMSYAWISLLYDILFFSQFFNWRIIALQNCVVFCHTSTSVSHRYPRVPSLPDLHLSPSSPLFSLSQSPCFSSLSLYDTFLRARIYLLEAPPFTRSIMPYGLNKHVA